jgi:outer membrane receptor protein involved in Fe transport
MGMLRGNTPAQLLLVAATAAMLCTTLPAHAELEEITVTARKREESIQNIPVAVTVVSGEELDRLSLKSLEQIASSKPDIVIARGSNGSGATISTRGIGSTFTSIGVEQSVAVNVDGVYYGQGRVINEGFFDMSQVEILKGPQALFFGKNATAGAIAFTTANPGSSFEALARAGYEFEARESRIEGVVSGPLTDTLGMRIALRGSFMGGGYVVNNANATTYTSLDVANNFAATVHNVPAPVRDVPEQEDAGARVTLRYAPTDELTVTLKGSGTRYRVSNATWNNELVTCPIGGVSQFSGEPCTRDWKISQNDVPADIAATHPIVDRHHGHLYQDYDSVSFTADASYDLPWVSLNSVSGVHRFVNYFLGDYDATGVAEGGVWGIERSKYEAFSSELRAQTTLDGTLNFMAGLYYQTTRLDFDQDAIFLGGLADTSVADPSARYVGLRKKSRTDGETFAVFGQVMWKFSPDWELTAGARFTDETKDSFFIQPYVNAALRTVFAQYDPADPRSRIAADQSFNNVSPEAALTWKPADRLTVYAAYKEGFKSGGFSGSAINSLVPPRTTTKDLAFGPELASGYEAGVRSTSSSNRLRWSATAFRYEYDDFQVDFFDTSRVTYITFNAATARTQGLELQAEWTPAAIAALTVTGSLAYTDAEFTDFIDAPCYSGQSPAQGCRVAPLVLDPSTTRASQDLTGSPTALAPKWTGSLGLNYLTAVGGNLMLQASANARYSSKYFLNGWANPLATQGAYTTVDASLALRNSDGSWEVALIGKNLTDKYVLTSAIDAPNSGANTGLPNAVPADQLGTPEPPRTIALQFTYKH